MLQETQFDLVIFLSTDWERFTRKRLILKLADQMRLRGGKILCLERPICPFLAPLFHREKFRSWFRSDKRLRQVSENIYVAIPCVFLHDIASSFLPFINTMNKLVLRMQIQRVLKKLRFRVSHVHVVTWIFNPWQVYSLGVLKDSLKLYECYDRYEKTPGLNRALRHMMLKKERETLRRADIVLTTSKKLFEIKNSFHNAHFVPNGVDFEIFVKASEKTTPTADEVSHLEKPVIGFVGKINESIDFALINILARDYPVGSIVMLGMFENERALLKNEEYVKARHAKNVIFPGFKKYEHLPYYIKAFDVCIIPYKINPYLECVYPLKLHEYMASGKPIVSTNLPEIEPFKDVVMIAKDHEEFSAFIAEYEGRVSKNDVRIEIARQNSWENRGQKIISIIEDTMRHKENGLKA